MRRGCCSTALGAKTAKASEIYSVAKYFRRKRINFLSVFHRTVGFAFVRGSIGHVRSRCFIADYGLRSPIKIEFYYTYS